MRETGALLAGAIGFVVVEEPFSAARLLTTLIAVIGVAALHLG